jgi:hypothetical protein
MSSLRRREGYLLVDNSSGPGVSEEQLAKLPHKSTLVPVAEGKKFEAAILTCHHCHIQMIRNPERVRERAYCRKCDHYICDRCADVAWRTGECRPLKAVLDDLQEQQVLREQAGLPPGEILISK